jgi:hypothetical protein
MDVNIDFFNGIIEEEIYIEKPYGFELHGREYRVCRLKKTLYELKQEPKAWYFSMGFTKSEVDPNLYFILVGENPLILVLYMDYLFLTSAEELIVG